MWGLRQVVPPATEPVTLQEVKLHLRVDVAEDDDLISAIITAARERIEAYTRRSIITQTWELLVGGTGPYLSLPRPPVQRIESITADGELVSPSRYQLLRDDFLVMTTPVDATSPGGVVIRYVAGYGDAPASVPQAIRQAILMLVAHMYESREGQAPAVEYEVQARGGVDLPPTVASLLRPYRVIQL